MKVYEIVDMIAKTLGSIAESPELEPVRSCRTGAVPDRTGLSTWTGRFLPVSAGFRKLCLLINFLLGKCYTYHVVHILK